MARKKRQEKPVDEAELAPRMSPPTKSAIIGVLLLALTGLILLAFFNNAGVAGQYLKNAVQYLFGQGSFLLPLGALAAGLSFLVSLAQPKHRNITLGVPLTVVAILAAFQIFGADLTKPETLAGLKGGGAGGVIGYLAAWPFLYFLGKTASVLIMLAIIIVALLFTFDAGTWGLGRRSAEEEEAGEAEELMAAADLEAPAAEEKEEKVEFQPSPILTNVLRWLKRAPEEKLVEKTPPPAIVTEAAASLHTLDGVRRERKKTAPRKVKPSGLFPDGYQPPPLTFLETGSGTPSSGDIAANKNIIKRTLKDFGIEAEMGEVNVGPAVAQYTLKPASGVNLSRITALRKNLSLALSAHPIRVEAPIPGKAYVGIEIPNRTASTVRLRPLIELIYKEKPSSALFFPLGKDVSGQPVFADLGKMPHLLIAGATGSGKSVAVNNIINSFIYTNSPRLLKLLLIDPKRVELTPYNDIPHLLSPVVVEPKRTINVLKWAVAEMDRRYQILAAGGSRDIVSYNAKVRHAGGEDFLPMIVIVIDELADLMALYKKEMEAAVVRLAQMARAVGLHLIASTQRPSTDVITGLIKANIPVRVAFKVASQVDSRTILDQAGAEKLLGSGDMLYMAGDSSGLKRIQGVFISEPEVRRVTAFLREQGGAQYEPEVLKERRVALIGLGEEGGEADDELYEAAKTLAFEAGKLSASLLQRRLRVGYARAARLLDILEERGVIGPADGAKPREVLLSQESTEEEDLT